MSAWVFSFSCRQWQGLWRFQLKIQVGSGALMFANHAQPLQCRSIRLDGTLKKCSNGSNWFLPFNFIISLRQQKTILLFLIRCYIRLIGSCSWWLVTSVRQNRLTPHVCVNHCVRQIEIALFIVNRLQIVHFSPPFHLPTSIALSQKTNHTHI